MKRIHIVSMVVALALTAGLVASASAQTPSTLRGELRDYEGKPLPDATIIIKNIDMGQTWEVKTDRKGLWVQGGLRSGPYEIGVKVKDTIVYSTRVRVASGSEENLPINFKELREQQGAAQAEAQKKSEEEQKKFEDMKAQFDSGVATLEEAKTLRNEIQRTPPDQRGPIQEKLSGLYQTAIHDFQNAEKGMSETDINRHVVLAKLGETYEAAGKYEEAIAAYQKAVELKPDQAGYYNNLGNALAKLGKIPEAEAAYQKSASLDPVNAASAWRNLGIVLYNAGKMKEAIEPLRKSLEIDSKSAQTWYLLGATLVGAMDFKKEGDKLIPVLQPGTVEAYQKCIELDPNGPWGSQAKQGLEAIEQMGLGIETKVKARKKK